MIRPLRISPTAQGFFQMKQNCRSDFTKLEARVSKKEIALFLSLLAFGECTCLLLCLSLALPRTGVVAAEHVINTVLC